MKIYINTAKTPAAVTDTLSAKTDAAGVLRVYSSSGASGISQFNFKRATTVPVDVLFPEETDVARLRFGLKLKGRFDDVLAVAAETAEAGTVSDTDTGFKKYALKITFDAAAIDSALAVNSASSDDVEKAEFISEFAWENADGEVSATSTIPTVIYNNVCRRGDAVAGMPFGAWSALMVVKIVYADYLALPDKNPDTLYVVPDAPDPIEEHNANPAAHAETLAALEANLAGRIDELGERVTVNENTVNQIPAVMPASSTVSGTVFLAESYDDERLQAVIPAGILREKFSLATFYHRNNSGDNFEHIFGKVIFAINNGDDGGFYAAGSESSKINWQQWQARYQWHRIRSYGKPDEPVEDYYFHAGANGSDPGLQIARMKDIPDLSGYVPKADFDALQATVAALQERLAAPEAAGSEMNSE